MVKKLNSYHPYETMSEPVDSEPTLVLDVDKLCAFVFSTVIKVWIWVALNRGVWEVVAYACGDQSDETCQMLWDCRLPAYKKITVLSDYVESVSSRDFRWATSPY